MMDDLHCWLDGHNWDEVSKEHYQYAPPILEEVPHPARDNELLWQSQLCSLNWISDVFITYNECNRCGAEDEVRESERNQPPVEYYQWSRMYVPSGRIVLPAGYIKSKCGKYFEPGHE